MFLMSRCFNGNHYWKYSKSRLGTMQLNFSVVFPEGVLENAPQFNVLTTYVPNEDSSADLQRDLVKNFQIFQC